MKLLRYLLIAAILAVLAIPVSAYLLLNFVGLEQLKPTMIEKVNAYTGRKLTIDGDISAELSFTPTITASGITLSNADWADDQPMLEAERLSASLDFRGLLQRRLAVNDITVQNATLRPQQSGERKNWIFTSPSQSARHKNVAELSEAVRTRRKFTFDIEQVTLNSVTINARMDKQSYNVVVPSLKTQLLPTILIDGRMDYQGTAFTLSANSKAGGLNQFASAPLNVTLTTDGKVEFDFNGTLTDMTGTPAFDGNLAFATDSLDHLNTLIPNGDLPASPEIGLSSPVTLKGKTIELPSLKAHYGDTVATGSLTIAQQQLRPQINATLTVDRYTLPASSQASSNERQTTTAPSPGDIPSNIISFEPLRAVDANISLALGELIKGDKTLASEIQTRANLKSGVLHIDQYSAKLPSGTIAGNGRINANSSPANLNLNTVMRNSVIADLLKAYGINAPVEQGKFDADIQLSTQGNTTDALMANASGSITHLIETMQYRAPASVGQAGSFLNSLRGKQSSGSTAEIHCILGTWNLQRGTMKAQQVLIDTPITLVSVNGNVQLPQQQLALTLNSHPKRTGLSNLPVPIRVSGSIASPQITAAPDAALRTLAQIGLNYHEQAGQGYSIPAIQLGGQDITLPAGCLNDLPTPDAAPITTREGLKQLEDDVKQDFKNVEDNVRDVRDNIKGLKKLFD